MKVRRVQCGSPVEFGRKLKHFLWRDEIVGLLPDCGWNDGGCRSLMKAMTLWLGEENVTHYQIVKREEDTHSEHAFVKVGDYFVDGDGVSSELQMWLRWIYEEHLPYVFIRSFDPSKEPAHRNGEEPFYIEDEKIQILANLLDQRFCKQDILLILNS